MPRKRAKRERDPIEEAEWRMGADGTDEYFREVTGRNERSEPD